MKTTTTFFLILIFAGIGISQHKDFFIPSFSLKKYQHIKGNFDFDSEIHNQLTDDKTEKKDKKRTRSIFLELAGNGIYASLNYEYLIYTIKNSNKHFLAIKLGLAPFITINTTNITSTYNIGNGKDYIEFGAGLGYYFSISEPQFIVPYYYFIPVLGYRRMSKSGFLFRSFLTLLTYSKNYSIKSYSYNTGQTTITSYSELKYYPFVGISLGYNF